MIDAIIVIVVKKLRYVSYGKVIHYNKLFNPAPAWPSAIIPLSKYHQHQAAGGLRYVLRYRRGLRFLPSYLKVWRGGRLKRDTIRYVPIPEELAVWRKFSAQSGKLEPVSGGRNAFKRTDSKLWNTYDRTFKCHAHALIDIKPKS